MQFTKKIMSHKPAVIFEDWSICSYQEAWTKQQAIHDKIKAAKVLNNRQSGSATPEPNRLIFCEHPPVYTLGKSGSEEHLLIPDEERNKQAIEYFKINRGGDITFHGPGQLVVYPIFDLDHFYHDVHRYVRELEEVIIRTVSEFDLKGYREPNYTGVWLKNNEDGKSKRKICAIGVHLSRWVTLHGLAFNINTDLKYFSYIVPCGIQDKDKSVSSLQQELGNSVKFDIVKKIVKHHFAEVFSFNYTP